MGESYVMMQYLEASSRGASGPPLCLQQWGEQVVFGALGTNKVSGGLLTIAEISGNTACSSL